MGIFPDDPYSRATSACFRMKEVRRKETIAFLAKALNIPTYKYEEIDNAYVYEDGKNHYEALEIFEAIKKWIDQNFPDKFVETYEGEAPDKFNYALSILAEGFKIERKNCSENKEKYKSINDKNYLYGDGEYYYEDSDIMEAIAAWINCKFPKKYRPWP